MQTRQGSSEKRNSSSGWKLWGSGHPNERYYYYYYYFVAFDTNTNDHTKVIKMITDVDLNMNGVIEFEEFCWMYYRIRRHPLQGIIICIIIIVIVLYHYHYHYHYHYPISIKRVAHTNLNGTRSRQDDSPRREVHQNLSQAHRHLVHGCRHISTP